VAETKTSEWLAVFGHPVGLAWVLEHGRLAFESSRAREVKRLQPGERILMYAAQGAYKPKAKAGGVIAHGRVTSKVELLDEPWTSERRDFTLGAELSLDGLLPHGEVVEIPPLLGEPGTQAQAGQLKSFPNYGPRSWMTVLRKPLVRLQPGGADLLIAALTPGAQAPASVLDGYRVSA
jgi:hypothetical protein